MMNLINYRSNPWGLFNDAVLRHLDGLMTPNAVGTRMGRDEFPKYDVKETDKCYVMSFDLPGVKKENLNIEVKDGVLTVCGERKSDVTHEGTLERFYGNFTRSFSLPDHVDGEKIGAHYEDGVLYVALPKTEAKAGKKVEISYGANSKGIFAKLIGHVKEEEKAA